jgi:hypothetical protein
MTTPLPPLSASSPPLAGARRVHGRPAQARRLRARATGLVATCLAIVLGTAAAGAQARKAKPAKAASSPSTAQILAPSVATTPDALPPDRTVYRCGDSYSARSCAPSQKPLDIADARSDAQRRQSEDLTSRDSRLAAWYAAQRREREMPPSSPVRSRPTTAAAACVSNDSMACVPKKPRTRTVKRRGASTPGMARQD